MSYILEALKKAQAERQLGGLPNIHAPTLDAAAAVPATPLKRPLLVAIGIMGIVIVALLALVWKRPGPVAEPAAPPVALPAVSAPAAAPAAAPAPAAAAAAISPAAAPAPAATVLAAPAPTVPTAKVSAPPVQAVVLEEVTPPPRAAKPEPVEAAPAKVAQEARAAPVEPAAPAKSAAAAQDEAAPLLRELPEPIQRSIPAIAMGGYMYSRNPADRLLLIDKVLRHEGEEVAPGLVLEKLQPKAAVFSFKGYRYRVPY